MQKMGYAPMKITIKEVAQLAGVSIATVSRVLNEKNKVHASTRNKVQQAIEHLNFQPDQNARTMISKSTKTIGMLVPELKNEFWVLLLDVVQKELWERGYTLIVGSTDRQKEKEIAFARSFIERRVDGIIYGSSVIETVEEMTDTIELTKRYGIPFVTLDPAISQADCVFGDHIQGATDATEHLIRLGHRNIAYIGGRAVSNKRELGYRNAFMMHHLIVNEALIQRIEGLPTFEHGYEAARRLLQSGEKFTAIFCGNDMLAFGTIRALEEHGWAVPHDIAVVGYDDVHSARLLKPALTTVRQPLQDIGEALVELIMDSPSKDINKLVPKKIIYQMQLVIRDSCGAKPVDAVN